MSGSAFELVVAHRLPEQNQVVFLGASRRLASGTIMGMEMSCAMGHGVLHSHVPLEPLVQIAGLRDVDRNPPAVLVLSGIYVIARQRLEGSVQ